MPDNGAQYFPNQIPLTLEELRRLGALVRCKYRSEPRSRSKLQIPMVITVPVMLGL